MDADKPTPAINLAQHELDTSRALWAAEQVRRIAENDAPKRPQPGDKLDGFPTRTNRAKPDLDADAQRRRLDEGDGVLRS